MKYSIRYKFARFLRDLGFNFGAESNAEVKNMQKTIAELPGKKIIFEVIIDEDGNWAAEAQNLDGLMTGGNIKDNIYEMITDAIFTYFNIAPQYCDERLFISSSVKKKKPKEIFKLVTVPNLGKATA